MRIVLHQVTKEIQIFCLSFCIILPFSENGIPFIDDNDDLSAILRVNIFYRLNQIITIVIQIRISFFNISDDQLMQLVKCFCNRFFLLINFVMARRMTSNFPR